MACRGIWLWIASLVVVAAPVAAQDAYPNRPVRWIVPFPAGGPTDTLSRIFAAKLGEQWGQSVVVENKGGASGAEALMYMKSSEGGRTDQDDKLHERDSRESAF